ncbi:hypothetical protein BDZ89DRAFT_1079638 [Hymenopellis radicata]|nr:hypothetical protein BDZ89DRAFT_1079638 [Hymenopellis radicata]
MSERDVHMSGPEPVVRPGAASPRSAQEPAMTIEKPATDISSLMNPAPPALAPVHDRRAQPGAASPPLSSGRFQSLPTPHSPSHFGQFTFPQTPESPLAHQRCVATFGRSMMPVAIPFRLANSPATSPTDSSRPSQATSPFMAKLLAAERQQRHSAPNSSQASPMQIDDLFSTGPKSSLSTPPTSPPINITSSSSVLLPPPPGVGGEIDRIRQAMAQEQQELESRRPDYLQRTKRESEPPSLAEHSDIPVHPSVGILESPNKGRRIKLFQETSEESFEESLMAGGYGRYRTADWVRQPQPLLLTTPGSAGSSKILSALEKAEVEEPPPPTEKELKKRKRLDAFKSDTSSHSGPSTLFPVELEGKGRVLLDIPNESLVADSPRKRGATRRRKKGELAKELLVVPAPEEHLDSPNWCDAEFPWRLRTEERTEAARLEERARLAIIETFLERDTDEEDNDEVNGGGSEEAAIPSSQWGLVYDNANDRPTPSRMGRGKMIPLAADPAAATNLSMERKRRSYFPSDPADARAALLSKRSVRALSYRRDKRLRGVGRDRMEDQLCVCRGTDDGRELVQCDDCKMWYHLSCLGIRHNSELGPEQEPWYCFDCHRDSRPSSPEAEDVEMHYREPTFVPTEESPRIRRTYDTPFYNGLQDSPLPSWHVSRPPKTPVRGGEADAASVSRYDYHYEPGGTYYDDHFDPTSTPSRGTKLGAQAAFATPKTTLFGQVSRPNGAFQTPSRRRTSGSNSRLPGTVSFSGMDESPYGRFPVSGFHYDDSPVRRTGRRGSMDGLPGPSNHMQD